MKKNLPLVFLSLLVILSVILLVKKQTSPEQKTGQPTPTPVTVLPIEKRPYVTLTPRADGHELKLEIININEAWTIEYELLYLGGSRGVSSSPVELRGENSFARDLLLGSCSKNVCKYDEGVKEGTLTLRLNGEKEQKYELGFNLQTGNEAKDGLVSADKKFIFQGNLPPIAFYVTQQTVGLPKMPEGRIIGGPYGIFTAGSAAAKGTIKLRLDETSPQVKIFGWDKSTKTWKQYQKGFETDGEVVSVEVDRLTTYTAVSP